MLKVGFLWIYFESSCFTRVEIRRPSASPASFFVATPMALPISDGWDALVFGAHLCVVFESENCHRTFLLRV